MWPLRGVPRQPAPMKTDGLTGSYRSAVQRRFESPAPLRSIPTHQAERWRCARNGEPRGLQSMQMSWQSDHKVLRSAIPACKQGLTVVQSGWSMVHTRGLTISCSRNKGPYCRIIKFCTIKDLIGYTVVGAAGDEHRAVVQKCGGVPMAINRHASCGSKDPSLRIRSFWRTWWRKREPKARPRTSTSPWTAHCWKRGRARRAFSRKTKSNHRRTVPAIPR